jgi:acetylornithine deacetylase/succinyl-diaminopimelate desuccinylase-like protein
MSRRRDALAAAAEMVLAAGRLARKAGPPAVATSGFMRAEPGIFGMVAGTSELGIEVRHAERGKLVELAAAVGQQCRTIAEEHGIEIALEESAGHEPVAMSAALIEAAEKTADRLRLSHRRLASGAAHDVAVFARHGVPALLIFVPSRHGVAHSPDEFTEPIHLQNGQRFLLELARWLTEGKG